MERLAAALLVLAAPVAVMLGAAQLGLATPSAALAVALLAGISVIPGAMIVAGLSGGRLAIDWPVVHFAALATCAVVAALGHWPVAEPGGATAMDSTLSLAHHLGPAPREPVAKAYSSISRPEPPRGIEAPLETGSITRVPDEHADSTATAQASPGDGYSPEAVTMGAESEVQLAAASLEVAEPAAVARAEPRKSRRTANRRQKARDASERRRLRIAAALQRTSALRRVEQTSGASRGWQGPKRQR